MSDISKLFSFRRIPHLLQWAGEEGTEQFLEQLIKLQSAIYALDQYLEITWEIDQDQVEAFWRDIYAQLTCLGIPESEQMQLTRHIKKYEILERGVRHGHLLSRMPIRNIYFIKSCDVKLMRLLTFKKFQALGKSHNESDWTVFDLFSEVHDDMEDVFEDMTTYNGNRFLISILDKGFEQSMSEYRRFLNSLEREFNAWYKQEGTSAQHAIAAWTEETMLLTKSLFETRCIELQEFDLATTSIALRITPIDSPA